MSENDVVTKDATENNDATRQPTSALPSTARVVVIGGGAVGREMRAAAAAARGYRTVICIYPVADACSATVLAELFWYSVLFDCGYF